VFLAAGLFTSGLRAASAPAAIPFENDAAFNVTLSNTNPSKVVVDGELITSISGPTGAMTRARPRTERSFCLRLSARTSPCLSRLTTVHR
jgi:hypothetical protein